MRVKRLWRMGWAGLLGVAAASGQGTGSGLFSWSRLSGPIASYAAVAASEERVVALGPDGAFATSEDVFHFDYRERFADWDFHGAAYGDGRFVAVGEAAAIWTSADGLAWEERSPELPRFGTFRPRLNAVVWTGAHWVAAGYNGLLLVSEDLVSWENPYVGDHRVVALAWTGSRVVAAAEYGVLASEDGLDWSVVENGAEGLRDLVWTGERLVGVGDGGRVFLSDDGTSWETREVEARGFNRVAWNGGRLVALGDVGEVAWSDDGGERWETGTTVDTSGGGHLLEDVIWLGSVFVAVGQNDSLLWSATGERWVPVSPPGKDRLNRVIQVGDRLVAVGDGGAVASSRDGIAWQRHETGFSFQLLGVAHTGSEYVAIGGGNRVLRSSDLTEWSELTLPHEGPFFDVATSGSVTVAVGLAGVICASADLEEWTELASPTSLSLFGIDWNGEGFAAVGRGPLYEDSYFGELYSGTLLRSSDGWEWELEATLFESQLNTVSAAGDAFVAAGDYSIFGYNITADGFDSRFVIETVLPDYFGIAANATTTVLVGERGAISFAPNGTPEVTAAPNPTGANLLDVAWSGERFVAVGDRGVVTFSVDGRSWDSIGSASTRALQAVIHGGGQWLAIGDDPGAMTSPDGRVWTSRRVRPDNYESLSDALWDGERYMAVGAYVGGGPRATVMTSVDGTQWTETFRGEYLTQLNAVCRTSDGYAACGNGGQIYLSADGENWDLVETGAFDLRDIEHRGGVTVAVGALGEVVYSDDGEAWTMARPLARALEALAWTGEGWLAAGNGVVLASEDGRSWEAVSSFREDLTALHWTGRYVIGMSRQGAIYYSRDGVDWTPGARPLAGAAVNGMAYANGRMVAVGGNGLVLLGEEFDGLAIERASGGFQARFGTPVGGVFELQRQVGALDAARWEVVSEAEAGDGGGRAMPAEVSEDGLPVFYRLRYELDW